MQPEPKRERTWLWVVLTFLVFWCGYLYFFSPRHRRGGFGGESFPAGLPADYGWEFEDLSGQPVSLSKYRGKTVFLNVWATWCGPCVAELPSISKLAQNPALKDVVFLCVSVDENPESVRRFVKQQNPLAMTIVWSKGRVPDMFQSDAIPSTYLIGPDGRISAHEIGGQDWNNPQVIKQLESLAKTPPANL
jgi:thiol-disulfide isomerase/thioredoxin